MHYVVGSNIGVHMSFSYKSGKEVLHDVSFSVKPGESIALIGPTGACKSTIVKCILTWAAYRRVVATRN